MRTNTARQQTVRHMTPAAKAAMLDADIEAGYQRQQAYLTEQRRRRDTSKRCARTASRKLISNSSSMAGSPTEPAPHKRRFPCPKTPR